ncbi:MAG: hypothetical protein KF861_18500, partial [Planctomycetaceae bacterium]|nr:hypothetical protein [Planctomycetaceae bacterium]
DGCAQDPAKTAPGLCGCGVSDATPLCLFNGDFQTGDLTNWTANSGSGAVSVELEDGVGNYAGKLITGSPVSLSINVNTPDEFFWVTFDAKFLTTSGELTVRLNGVELVVVAAPESPDPALRQHVFAVHQAQLRNLSLKPLSFTFDGPTGSEMFLDNVAVIPGSAGEDCVHGGDSIGPDSSWTDGWGANTANGQDSGWAWHHNGGHPAILYTSDGHSPLVSIRSIVAAAEHTDGNGTNWSKYNWTIDIWPLASYLSKGQPIVTINLGPEPDNWSGFIEHDVRNVTPNTAPFGVPGGNAPAGTVSYELIFDLRHVPALAEPLPAGEYILGLQSRHGMSGFGTTAVLSSRVGVGPEPYYSATDRDVPTEPTKVIGVLTQNALFRWALSFTERKLSCP